MGTHFSASGAARSDNPNDHDLPDRGWGEIEPMALSWGRSPGPGADAKLDPGRINGVPRPLREAGHMKRRDHDLFLRMQRYEANYAVGG